MALYTIRSGVNNHPEDTFLQNLTDVVRSGGVIDLIGGDYLVGEPGGGGLNVDVAIGRGYVKGSGNAYPIRNTATETIEINANSSGNPRITTIVAVVDLSVTPGSTDQGSDVHKILTVDGTPASSPIAPDDGAIQTAVGGASPWIKLANVTVAHGASGISNANITDLRHRVFLRSYSPLVSVDFSSTYSHDYSRSNQFTLTLTGNLTINEPTNMDVGDILIARVVQDGTGGRSVNFHSNIVNKSSDIDPASGANETTTYALHKTSATNIDLFLVGKDY